MVLVIGFVMAACEQPTSDSGPKRNPPTEAFDVNWSLSGLDVTGIDKKLYGKWVSTKDQSELWFGDNKVGAPGYSYLLINSKEANKIMEALKNFVDKSLYPNSSLQINSNKIDRKLSGGTLTLYEYEVKGDTLTIYDYNSASKKRGAALFTGDYKK